MKEELSCAIRKIVGDLGYECVNVAMAMEGGRSVIRVIIDSLGGITVSDCEVVSKVVNRYLDEWGSAGEGKMEGLDDKYYLEVSSPGLERPLFTFADYERFKGKEVRIKTSETIGGRKVHTGFVEVSGKCISLQTEEGILEIPFESIVRGSLVYRGLEPQEPKKLKKTDKKMNSKNRKLDEFRKHVQSEEDLM